MAISPVCPSSGSRSYLARPPCAVAPGEHHDVQRSPGPSGAGPTLQRAGGGPVSPVGTKECPLPAAFQGKHVPIGWRLLASHILM